MKTICITLILAVAAGVIIAGIISSEHDSDRAQELSLAEKRAGEAYDLKRASGVD